MKSMKNKLLIGVFTFFIALSIVVSCKNDDQMGSVNQASLETLLTEANDLITNSVEGINAGDYKPGSKDALQEVVT